MDFLFNGISIQEQSKYLQNIIITKRTFLRNEVIFHEGDICNSITFINSGSVTAKRIYADGHETIIRILSMKDTIGEALIFSSDNQYKATFISDTKSILSYVKYNDLLFLIKESSTIALNLLNKISNNLISINNQLKILSKKSVKAKICEYLYLEYQKYGLKTFTINLNKTDLASLLNVERPTFSKELSNLIAEGIIANVGYSYTIINYAEFEKYL